MNEQEKKEVIKEVSDLKEGGETNKEIHVQTGIAGRGKMSSIDGIINSKATEGIIIAAYPGMGQEVYTSMYDNYVILNVHDAYIVHDGYGNQRVDVEGYVRDAMNLVSNPDGHYDVCFVDPITDVIEELKEYKKPFFILFPTTKKESILKTLAIMYHRNPSVANGQALTDVILNHDHRIEVLKSYPNSIVSTTGIINQTLITELLTMDEKGRFGVMSALASMKSKVKLAQANAENKQEQANKQPKK